MFESVQNLALNNPLEFYTAIVATFGVAFWAIDRRSMMAAIKATKGSEITALRLERHKTEASVERSFVTLQVQCQVTRNAWQNHDRRNGPMLRSPLHVSEEQKEIRRIEREARVYLDRLKASAPKLDSVDIEQLEAFFTAANRTALDFARLESQLPKPNNSYH